MAFFALPPLESGLPDELVSRMRRIERCLRLSYLDYELFDIILGYALTTVEMGLRLRYKAHFGELPRKSFRFNDQVNWAKEEGLLEGMGDKVDFLRKFRNDIAHPKRDSFGAIALAPTARFVFEVTNCLFSSKCKSCDARKEAVGGTDQIGGC